MIGRPGETGGAEPPACGEPNTCVLPRAGAGLEGRELEGCDLEVCDVGGCDPEVCDLEVCVLEGSGPEVCGLEGCGAEGCGAGAVPGMEAAPRENATGAAEPLDAAPLTGLSATGVP